MSPLRPRATTRCSVAAALCAVPIRVRPLRALVPILLAAAAAAQAPVPVVTMLADFDDDSVGLTIGETRRVAAADCRATRASIPARGSGSLALEIGATSPGASAVCDLAPRSPVRFEQAERVGAFVWLAGDKVRVAFRVRDDADTLFETAPVLAGGEPRWLLAETSLAADALRPVAGEGRPAFPIRVVGVRAEVERAGKCVVNIDEVQVAHQVAPRDSISGEFSFDNPTRIFTPGSTVGAMVNIENRSRSAAVSLSCELTWLRPDGRILKSQRRTGIELHASSADYRSRQPIDFSLPIADPGLYRLVARVRAPGWSEPAVFATSIAVTPSNKHLSRGRQTLFGVRSRMLYESLADERLELDLTRALGVQLLALEVPWREVQPRADVVRLARLDALVDACVARDIAPMLCLDDPPAWIESAGAPFADAQAAFLADLARHYGQRVRLFQVARTAGEAALERAAAALSQVHADCRVLPRDAEPAGAAAGMKSAARLHVIAGSDAESALSPDAAAARRAWSGDDWWELRAAPELGAGDAAQAEAALRFFLSAAQAGVAGVIWSELRDRDNDPRRLDAFRGLVRRDFSPRHRLFGFAAAVGLLHGTHFVGPLVGAPPEFESAVFVGAKRQVAALVPRPGAAVPGLLAPVALVPGTLTVEDGGRVPRPWLLESPSLIAALDGLQFMTLETSNAFPDAQLALSRPFVDLPRVVWVEGRGELKITARPPATWRSSFAQLVLPPQSPLTAPAGAIVLKGAEGETIEKTVELRAAAPGFQSASALLRFSIEGTAFEVPLIVGEQVALKPLPRGAELKSEPYRIGRLAAATANAPGGDVFAAATGAELSVEVRLTDDRVVAFSRTADGVPRGDYLNLVAVGPGGRSVKIIVGADGKMDKTTSAARLSAQHQPTSARSNEVAFRVSIPSERLGIPQLISGQYVVIAIEYRDEDDGPDTAHLTFGDVFDARSRGVRLRVAGP